MKLPEDNKLIQTVPDCLHTVKDVVEKTVCLVTGENIKHYLWIYGFIICIQEKLMNKNWNRQSKAA